MKPGESVATTVVFFHESTSVRVAFVTVGLEPSHGTTSTSGSTGAGLKKWMPITRSGRTQVRARLDTETDKDAVREEIASAQRLGVNGVPFFIFGGKYALSGAQPPEAFLEIFEAARREAEAPEAEIV